MVEHAKQISTDCLALLRVSRDLDQSSLFTHQNSAEAVKELQGRVFMEKADECETLELSLLPPREFPILSGALPCYMNLRVLQISNSQVDCHGAEALSTALTMPRAASQQPSHPWGCSAQISFGLQGQQHMAERDIRLVPGGCGRCRGSGRSTRMQGDQIGISGSISQRPEV